MSNSKITWENLLVYLAIILIAALVNENLFSSTSSSLMVRKSVEELKTELENQKIEKLHLDITRIVARYKSAPNTHERSPDIEVTITDDREAIRYLSQYLKNQDLEIRTEGDPLYYRNSRTRTLYYLGLLLVVGVVYFWLRQKKQKRNTDL